MSERRKSTAGFAPLRKHTIVNSAEVSPGAGKQKKRGRKGEGPEARIQKAWVKWAREKGLEIQHQNNGANSKAARIRLHAMGCTAGAADILVFDILPKLPEARGLALEFKAPDGEQTPDQIRWERRVHKLDWAYHVVRSVEEAIEVVQWYGLALDT